MKLWRLIRCLLVVFLYSILVSAWWPHNRKQQLSYQVNRRPHMSTNLPLEEGQTVIICHFAGNGIDFQKSIAYIKKELLAPPNLLILMTSRTTSSCLILDPMPHHFPFSCRACCACIERNDTSITSRLVFSSFFIFLCGLLEENGKNFSLLSPLWEVLTNN